MTRTEDRLQDALSARAGQVRDERLRPLPAPAPDLRRQARNAWLIPAAAAASVLLVIAVVVAVTRHAAVSRTQQTTSQVAMPGYFVQWAGRTGPSGRIQVRSVSTGAVIATVPPPKPPIADALDIEAVAAAPDDRTFYVEYGLFTPNLTGRQIWIFSFSLTGSGSVTPQTMIKGGPITNSLPGQQSWGNLAVSPDGTKLALTADSIGRVPALSSAYSDKIIVIDLLAGQRTQWQGGLFRTGKQFSIPDVSWSADGRSLIFLGQWCDLPGRRILLGRVCAGCVPRRSGLVAHCRDRGRLADPRSRGAAAIGPVPPHRASARRPRWLGPHRRRPVGSGGPR